MKCNTCGNYQVVMSGVNDGCYTACKEMFYTMQLINPMTKKEKQDVMDGKKKYCRGYEKF